MLMNALIDDGDDLVGLFLEEEEVDYPEYQRQKLGDYRATPRTLAFQDVDSAANYGLYFPVSSVGYEVDRYKVFSSTTGELKSTFLIAMGEIAPVYPGDEIKINLQLNVQ